MFFVNYLNRVTQWSNDLDYRAVINGISCGAIINVLDVEQKRMLHGVKQPNGMVSIQWSPLQEYTLISDAMIEELNRAEDPAPNGQDGSIPDTK